jgi:hypothetical protein
MYRFKRNLKFKRAITEQLVAGAALFEKSNESIIAEMIWLGINAKGYVGDSKDELAKFFMTLTPQGMLDMGSVTKVLKECGIIGKGTGMLETQKTDMIFTKVKGPSEKKLDFKRFIEFLYVISALVVSFLLLKSSHVFISVINLIFELLCPILDFKSRSTSYS